MDKSHPGLPAYLHDHHIDHHIDHQKLTLSSGHIVVTKPKVVPDGMGQVAAMKTMMKKKWKWKLKKESENYGMGQVAARLEDSDGPFC